MIKVGTQSILSPDGTPFESVMNHLVEQLVSLEQQGHPLVLVSSGAVSSGRRAAKLALGRDYGHSIGEKQVLASLGQYELMHTYATLFKKHQMLVSQLLLTKQDFHSRGHYLNISRLLSELLAHKNVIPIVNENDSVAIEELMFTDNDELAGVIAAQINADKLIILTNVEGVFTGSPQDPGSKLIPLIHPDEQWPEVSTAKSLHGRGGMFSKLEIARKMSKLGITTHIANIEQPFVITRLVNGEALGTCVLPQKKTSNIKKWIASHTQPKLGSVVINGCLLSRIKENKQALSILPVGIVECIGSFKRGDMIEILSSDKIPVGVGLARYDADTLQGYLGQKEKPEFIHYDHLHIF